mgnify:CR=1 FL=1
MSAPILDHNEIQRIIVAVGKTHIDCWEDAVVEAAQEAYSYGYQDGYDKCEQDMKEKE